MKQTLEPRAPVPGRGRTFGGSGWLGVGLLVACLLGVGLLACNPQAVPPSDGIARIDEAEILYRDFEAYLERNVGSEATSLAPRTLAKIFERFLDEELLLRSARDAGTAPEGLPRREVIRRHLTAAGVSAVEDAEVESFYAANQDRFQRPERVRLRQILVAERQDAESALEALEAGEDFTEVARRMSIGPNSHRGGDQGELAKGDLPPAFAEAVFGLKSGEVSQIVAAEYGYHIFQVTERRESSLVSLERAGREIRAELQQIRSDEAMLRLLRDARKRYNVTVYGRNLPFAYRGAYRVAEKTPN